MSNYYNLLTAVQESIEVVFSNVVLRRMLMKLESDSLPMVIVSPGKEGEKILSNQFCNNVIYVYPVTIAYVEAFNRNMTTGLDTYLEIREAIRNQLNQVRLNNTSVYDTDFNPRAATEFAAALGSNYQVTGWQMQYKISEERSA